MTKTDTKTKILEAGAEIVHEKGFNNAGLNEILKAAGVPKGSFYFYFESKDAFGLALIEHYVAQIKAVHRESGVMKHGRPDERLFAFFDSLKISMERTGYKRGCPIGNLAQEMSDLNEDFRKKLDAVFAGVVDFIQGCLEEGMKNGIFRKRDSVRQLAEFIFNSYEGAILRAKLSKDGEPFKQFRDNIEELIKEK